MNRIGGRRLRAAFALLSISFPMLAASFTAGCLLPERAPVFNGVWPEDMERVWVGPEFWANRLQDWRVRNGRLECACASPAKPMRTVHLLTRRLGHKEGDLAMSVRTGLILAGRKGEGSPESAAPGGASGKSPGGGPAPAAGARRVIRALPPPPEVSPEAAAGFLVGAGPDLDYRAAALIHHSPGPGGGLFAGIDGAGRLFIRDFSTPPAAEKKGGKRAGAGGGVEKNTADLVLQTGGSGPPEEVELHLLARPGDEGYDLVLAARDPYSGDILGTVSLKGVDPSRLIGNLALVSHPGRGRHAARFWFRDLQVAGSKVEAHNDRRLGPILSTEYTSSRGVLKMTAQMAPLGPGDNRTVRLEIREGGGWKTIARTSIVTPGYTATFRVTGWDSGRDVPYRVAYRMRRAGGLTREYSWSGTVRRDPREKETIVVAAFTGNHNAAHPGVDRGRFVWKPDHVWFPHDDVVRAVSWHRPDLLFFSGDQVYEGSSPTGADRSSLENSLLDYLYKWYLWCWAFRGLTRDIPCITIPDDHDVYQGNLWGAGGRRADRIDDGGYVMPPEFVKMVERTQTSHLPDPFDPAPVKQGIGVYFCALDWGRIGFAILEDRKFKSSPTVMVPGGKVRNGWFHNRDFDPRKADVPGATLLGERQLAFLHHWSVDLTGGVLMKAALSQTIFSNVATLPAKAASDAVVPRLKILPRGGYPENDRIVHDADSGGWPQTGRNKALRELRRGFAVHIAGDQHLGSTIQYGVDGWHDAAFAFCVPSIANFYPRRWFPPSGGKNRFAGAPEYTGDFLDGFGNRMTVYAVSNPAITGREPALLHDRSPGYGIVKFNKRDRTITFECWPRSSDPDANRMEEYPGWPITVSQLENYGRKAAAFLPLVEVTGMENPALEVIDETTGEILYALRLEGKTFRPKVFDAAKRYTLKVGDPDTGVFTTLPGIEPVAEIAGKPSKGAEPKIAVHF